MQKLTPHNVSGFISFLPEQQKEYDNMLKTALMYYEKNSGFNHIDLPCIGQKDFLLQGEGSDKEMFGVFKSGHDDLLLRFDQTQPLANYLATNIGKLKFPFTCYQYGKVWRAERAQSGRFREFYQLDMDTIERDKNITLDQIVEIFKAITTILTDLKIEHTFLISDRKIWDIIENPADRLEAMALVDKKNKLSPELFNKELEMLPAKEEVKEILKSENKISDVIKLLESNNIKNIKFDPTIVRGLSYYTGIVFETLVDGTNLSVASGGQYANFTSAFNIKNKINGFGGSLGMSRIYALINQGIIKQSYR